MFTKKSVFETKLTPEEFKNKLALYVSEFTPKRHKKNYEGRISKDSFEIYRLYRTTGPVARGKIEEQSNGSVIQLTVCLGNRLLVYPAIVAFLLAPVLIICVGIFYLEKTPSLKSLFLFSPAIIICTLQYLSFRYEFRSFMNFFNRNLKEWRPNQTLQGTCCPRFWIEVGGFKKQLI